MVVDGQKWKEDEVFYFYYEKIQKREEGWTKFLWRNRSARNSGYDAALNESVRVRDKDYSRTRCWQGGAVREYTHHHHTPKEYPEPKLNSPEKKASVFYSFKHQPGVQSNCH